MTNVENVGTTQVVYTVEPTEEEGVALVTFWLQSGGKIGSLNVPRDSIK